MKILPLISLEQIQLRIRELVLVFLRSEKDTSYIFITTLIGAKKFADFFLAELKQYPNISFQNYEIKLSSYGADTKSSGKISLEKDLLVNLENHKVFILEDIVDTGLTLSFFKNYLLTTKKVSEVKIITLLNKLARRKIDIQIDYQGFEVPDKFIVGFGIDYNQEYRELDYIGYLE